MRASKRRLNLRLQRWGNPSHRGSWRVASAAGDGLDRRKVLISPASVVRVHSTGPASAARAQVRDSPSVDAGEPVSRRYEIAHARHYLHAYWSGPLLWGAAAYPATAQAGLPLSDPAPRQRSAPSLAHDEIESADATHLHRGSEVMGYVVRDRVGDAAELTTS